MINVTNLSTYIHLQNGLMCLTLFFSCDYSQELSEPWMLDCLHVFPSSSPGTPGSWIGDMLSYPVVATTRHHTQIQLETNAMGVAQMIYLKWCDSLIKISCLICQICFIYMKVRTLQIVNYVIHLSIMLKQVDLPY